MISEKRAFAGVVLDTSLSSGEETVVSTTVSNPNHIAAANVRSFESRRLKRDHSHFVLLESTNGQQRSVGSMIMREDRWWKFWQSQVICPDFVDFPASHTLLLGPGWSCFECACRLSGKINGRTTFIEMGPAPDCSPEGNDRSHRSLVCAHLPKREREKKRNQTTKIRLVRHLHRYRWIEFLLQYFDFFDFAFQIYMASLRVTVTLSLLPEDPTCVPRPRVT